MFTAIIATVFITTFAGLIIHTFSKQLYNSEVWFLNRIIQCITIILTVYNIIG